VDRFVDGQLYVNLRGFGPATQPADPADVLHSLLVGLGVTPDRVPVDLDARASLYRSLLAGRRMLVLLDNAADPAQVRPLLPGAPGCLVVVTSRAWTTANTVTLQRARRLHRARRMNVAMAIPSRWGRGQEPPDRPCGLLRTGTY
jgi:hypothetical protein